MRIDDTLGSCKERMREFYDTKDLDYFEAITRVKNWEPIKAWGYLAENTVLDYVRSEGLREPKINDYVIAFNYKESRK